MKPQKPADNGQSEGSKTVLGWERAWKSHPCVDTLTLSSVRWTCFSAFVEYMGIDAAKGQVDLGYAIEQH